ncbi:hypothetical protein B566_EDAN007099 [Ephemera danica]|nr:hypothetical protein B566_EDAN007099 [Ephemera danica]
MVNGAYATALIVAAFRNHTEICKILLEAGAAPDIQNEMGRTALIYAVQNENLGLMKMLLDRGVNVEATTKEEGYTALHIASSSYRSSVEMLKLLVSHNANINAKNKKGETPLTNAWEDRNREAFIYLLKLGAKE